MPDVQLALEGKSRGNPVSATLTSPAVETAALDLGAAYEKFAFVMTAAQAANLASSNISFLVEDEEVYGEAGTHIVIAKPAAGVGIYHVVDAGWVRNVKVKVSVTPTSPATFSVYGINRVTKSTAEQLYNRTLA